MGKSPFERYDELYSKANDIYCRVIYPPSKMSRTSVLMSVKKSKKGFDLALHQENKIESVKYNEFGQIIGYGVFLDPYTKEPIPDKDVKELNKAIKLYKEALEIFPAKGSPYKYIGRIYHHLGLFDKAIDFYKIAIKKWPQYKQELNSRIEDCKLSEKGESHFEIETNNVFEIKEHEFKFFNKGEFEKFLNQAEEFRSKGDFLDQIKELEKALDYIKRLDKTIPKDNESSFQESIFIIDTMIGLRINLAELYYKYSINLQKIEGFLYHPAFDGGNEDAFYWLLKYYEKKQDTKSIVMCITALKKLSKDFDLNKNMKRYIIELEKKISKDDFKKAKKELKEELEIKFDEPLGKGEKPYLIVKRGSMEIVNTPADYGYKESGNKKYIIAIGNDEDSNEDESKSVFLIFNKKQIILEKKFDTSIGLLAISNQGTFALVLSSDLEPEFNDEELGEGYNEEGLTPSKLLVFDNKGSELINFHTKNSLLVELNIDNEGKYVACASAFPDNSAYLFDIEKNKLACKKKDVHRSVIDKIVFTPNNEVKFITGSDDSFSIDISGNLIEQSIQEGGQTKYYRLYNQGYSCFDNNDYETAEKLFLEALQNYKPHTGLLNVLARTEYELHKHHEAIKFWKQSIELSISTGESTNTKEKEMIKSFRNLIDNHIYKRNINEAIKLHNEMKEVCPNQITERDVQKIKKLL